MYKNLSNRTKRRRATLGALALSCAAIVYGVSASGCGSETAIIHDCILVDGGAPDGTAAGTGGATALPPCN
jgi:hypothetical protein